MSANRTAHSRPHPVVLCILDGWGERSERADNAIAQADTPTWDRLVASGPVSRLWSSAEHVGLPQGQMGNSEVGHMNLGAGRVVLQDLPRIDTAIADGSLAANPVLASMIERLRESGGTCHLMGLLSPGGVHSMQDHMVALARTVSEAGVPVAIHAFLDGRDTPPNSAKGYMETFLDQTAGLEGFRVATVSGRYYAMDRDKRWDRVQKAFDAMVAADGERADSPLAAIAASYDADKSDEFMLPTVIGDFGGIRDGDGVLMANFRADRAREILTALCDDDFDGFARSRHPKLAAKVGMTEYSKDLNACLETLFPPETLSGIFGEVLAKAGLTQLRIAETEKYAHVTFFFNGGEETCFEGEERILIPSPKVATYDLQPEMSAPEVTDRLVEAIEADRFDVIIVNYANGDMVGHTGFLPAAIEAAKTIDASLARLEAAVKAKGGAMLVTADHGNCEMMKDPGSGERHTAHTVNPVPLVLVGAPQWVKGLEEGRLADVAPTLLHLLGLDQPEEMTGRSLIIEAERRATA